MYHCLGLARDIGRTSTGLGRRRAGSEKRVRRRVAPILARRCLDCHSGIDPKGKLDLSRALLGTRRGQERARRSCRASPTRACSGSGSNRTRCRRSRRFPRPRRSRCGDWIARRGLGDRSDRSLSGHHQPPRRPRLVVAPARAPDRSAARRARGLGSRTPIDAFVLQKLEANGLSPAPEADRLGSDPPAQLRPDGLAARRPRRSTRSWTTRRPTPTSGSSIAISRRRNTASGGRGGGSTWPATARATDSNLTSSARMPGAIATGWSTPSTATCRTTSSPALQLAGDVLRPDDPGAVEATGFLVAGAYDTAGQNQHQPGHEGRRPERRAGRHRSAPSARPSSA